ncbi:hypothetical protein ISN45_Aa07g037170 [Arabidopsis thaliana x Arabidopsis arenosa]|uniref:Uncharacterized protein n=1 Tax=Arabidopsis thaliana x Arabidopsis arenosa TaxID=1240361 RepID=A0A8T1YD14_9BRAS|nr:hypothetical protein ISN45_Aa07g037170 [Arabidopsis thaliana x Arabidopsis arenosa]
MINLEKEEAKEKEILIRDGKRKIDHHVNTTLLVKIFEAFAIDDRDLLKPYYGSNYYFIKAWLDDTKQYGTYVVKGFKDYSFVVNQEMKIPLDFPAQYLYIELLKGFTYRDPGTSNGTVVMGRAKIRLPPLSSYKVISGDIDLVGLNSDQCVVKKGSLKYAMKIHRYVALED